MKKGGVGGANTQSGEKFERESDLHAFLQSKGMKIEGGKVFNFDKHVGYILKKHSFYSQFLKTQGIDWKSIISKQLLPDEAYISLTTNTLVIIEKKYQEIEGSTDEKLQTCDFKKKQYQKLCRSIKGIKVEYVYVLNDWFKKPTYKDVLDYIESVGCHYYFNQLPYELLGIEEHL
jgi:hypothetical protein